MNQEESDFGLPDFLRDPKGLLRRRWRAMLLTGLLGLAATGAVVATMPVLYVATSSILVSSQKIPDKLVETTVEESPFERINALIGEITSRERLLGIEERNDIYPELRGVLPAEELVYEVRQNIDISTDGGVGTRSRFETSMIYKISYRHTNASTAAAVANDLASEFTTASIRMRGQQAKRTTEFLRTQLATKEKELRKHDAQVADFKQKYRGELPSELDQNLAKIDRLAAEQVSVRESISQAETRLAMLTSGTSAAVPENSPMSRLNALRSKLAAERAVHTDEHPNILSLRRQVATLEKEIAEGGGGGDPARAVLIASAQRTIAQLQGRQAQIIAEIARREAQVATTPRREESMQALIDDGEVLREEYLGLLRKVETAELSESLETAQQGERTSVLDRALPPSAPERPRARTLALGALASFMAAALMGALLELRDPVLVSASQLESHFGLPVLGSVPRIS